MLSLYDVKYPHDFTTQVVTAADVCLLGLNIIMPLMSAELLKFPNLCLQVSKQFYCSPSNWS